MATNRVDNIWRRCNKNGGERKGEAPEWHLLDIEHGQFLASRLHFLHPARPRSALFSFTDPNSSFVPRQRLGAVASPLSFARPSLSLSLLTSFPKTGVALFQSHPCANTHSHIGNTIWSSRATLLTPIVVAGRAFCGMQERVGCRRAVGRGVRDFA